MFDQLLNFVIRATNIAPKYKEEHCLVVSRAVGGCDICKEVCPHEAITIKRKVIIDDIDCTGCGLCVQECPSQALTANVTFQKGIPLKCSQVKGGAQSVNCLARLQATDLMRLSGNKGSVKLLHGDCADCKIGTEAVLEAVDKVADEAKTLASLLGRDLEVSREFAEKYDSQDNPDKISRRDFLRGGLRSVQENSADVLAPLEALANVEEEKGLPIEHVKKLAIIEVSQPEPEDLVPWRLPRVAEGCIFCPVCTNICPTDAFSREFEKPALRSGGTLNLEPDKCNGCDACVTSCPVDVISMDDNVTYQELTGGVQAAFVKETPTTEEKTVSRN